MNFHRATRSPVGGGGSAVGGSSRSYSVFPERLSLRGGCCGCLRHLWRQPCRSATPSYCRCRFRFPDRRCRNHPTPFPVLHTRSSTSMSSVPWSPRVCMRSRSDRAVTMRFVPPAGLLHQPISRASTSQYRSPTRCKCSSRAVANRAVSQRRARHRPQRRVGEPPRHRRQRRGRRSHRRVDMRSTHHPPRPHRPLRRAVAYDSTLPG